MYIVHGRLDPMNGVPACSPTPITHFTSLITPKGSLSRGLKLPSSPWPGGLGSVAKMILTPIESPTNEFSNVPKAGRTLVSRLVECAESSYKLKTTSKLLRRYLRRLRLCAWSLTDCSQAVASMA
ncbi:hypothetical protein BDZ89DRAFT_359307 [Hymenopellis radicata]|nr:hypothetical protein BDZ89DRAFT_359307 [Hymenopellis radicata]